MFFCQNENNWQLLPEPGKVASLQQLEDCRSHVFNQCSLLKSADLLVDVENRLVTKGAAKIYLSQNDWQLLSCLLSAPCSAIARTALLEWLETANAIVPTANTLSVALYRLRKMLGSLDTNQYIETLRTSGYIWRYPVYALIQTIHNV